MTNTQFVTDALAKIDVPEVLVNVVSRRVRLLGQGARPLVEVHPRWTLLEVALKEIADGKLSFEYLDQPVEEAEEETPTPKKRKK